MTWSLWPILDLLVIGIIVCLIAGWWRKAILILITFLYILSLIKRVIQSA